MADGLLNKASIILTPTGYKAGTLYNVAPVVEPYEDFDFARASVASRVNSSGLVEMVGRTLGSELVTNGDFSTSGTPNTSSFTLGWYSNTSNVIIENGSLTMSNSASQSDSRAYATNGVSSNNILTTNKTYELKYDIIENNGVTNFKYYSSSGIFISAPSVEIGSYTIYIKNTSNQLFLFQNSSTNSSIKIDNVSVKEVIDTNNIPRISYDSNGENGHILLEPTSTNLISYSEDFSQWLIFDTITRISNYGTSPDGTQNSYKIGSSGGANDFIYLSLTITASQSHTLSFFIKNVDSTQTKFFNASEGTININWSGSTITSIDSGANYEAYGNGWYKITSTATSNSDGGFISRFYPSTSGTASVELYGYQLEELSYATSYIPTLTGSTETRATETATGAGSADLINSTEGVLYAEIAALSDVDGRWISLSNGTTNQRVSIAFQGDDIRLYIKNAGGLIWDYTYPSANIFNYNKIALKYKGGDYALWINGTEVSTDSNSNILSGLNSLQFDSGGGSSVFYGKCKALAVFNEALSDAELNNLTG